MTGGLTGDGRPSLEALRLRYPGAVGFTFGDGPELCARLLDLVRTGRKTATCGALGDYASADGDGPGEPRPIPGRHDVALHWDGRPALVIETTEVFVCRFDEVTWDFAQDEGETDDLDGWRAAHRSYFERTGAFAPDMALLCERFRLVEDLG